LRISNLQAHHRSSTARNFTDNSSVNTRNISQLLNVIAPCLVTEFKAAGLEYICLQLESLLENNLIDDLDEDLLLELDEVVRANQLNCLPFVKSGRFESELHERHPSLAGDIEEERQRRVQDMTFRAYLRDDDSRTSTSFRHRVGSLDDLISSSPAQDRLSRKSKAGRNAPFSPRIRPKDSTVDLMFDMDDDDTLSPKPLPMKPMFDTSSLPRNGLSASDTKWDDIEPEVNADDRPAYTPSSIPKSLADLDANNGSVTPPSAAVTKTWSSPALPSTKLDMREIMAQASVGRTSNLSMRLSAQKVKDVDTNTETLNKTNTLKLSQRERKKQKQQALQEALQGPTAWRQSGSGEIDIKPSSPWQTATVGPKTSLKALLNEPKASSLSTPTIPAASPIIIKPMTPRRTASPDTRFAGQSKSQAGNNFSNSSQTSTAGPSRPSPQQHAKSSPLVPHSKSYTSPSAKAEPSLQLSMADIIGQQRREQEVIKEAASKKSLQEIQDEQAFQEWWDQESKRAQEEEAAKAKSSAASGRAGKLASGSGKSGGRGRGTRGRGGSSQGNNRGRGKENGTRAGKPSFGDTCIG
jgi:hypothetical protein